jgi:hypothetical protein
VHVLTRLPQFQSKRNNVVELFHAAPEMIALASEIKHYATAVVLPTLTFARRKQACDFTVGIVINNQSLHHSIHDIAQTGNTSGLTNDGYMLRSHTRPPVPSTMIPFPSLSLKVYVAPNNLSRAPLVEMHWRLTRFVILDPSLQICRSSPISAVRSVGSIRGR